ncbi:hypothetical protein GCM10022237_36600 [Nocardioides ginsengisoli]|uniref:DUF4019 domain-containing protein n=1 Tax=Nocardioides ginsengisoli TaxID=363868 RepID=A0ABW3VVZ8_9ACTN
MSGTMPRIAVLVALVGVLTAVCVWLAVRGDDAHPAAPRATPVVPVAPAEESDQPVDRRAVGRWREIARAYSAALTDRHGGRQAWLRRLSPLVSRALLASYRDTDVARLPEGSPVRVRPVRFEGRVGPRMVRTIFDTGYELDVRMMLLGGHWEVTSSGQHLSRKRAGPALSGL